MRRPEEQCAVASLLDNHKFEAHLQQLAHTRHNTGMVCILANLLLTHEEHINPLDHLG